ncbi:SulP family inorganic anion transporter [Agromyces marinus]|uniref:SulP family inorganic anion transporter n=1 Tax=Agromyces marinus TaxID=1389020 RepID=UPI001EE9BD5F|nr:solute carrier family 23 protein [Agromyces marinus]UIP59941.1 putative sulfate transporter [Agromyces marinus]
MSRQEGAAERTGPFAELTPRTIVREVGAGVTLLAIAVPLNIGYAQIAGLPPTAGLYALIVPSIVFAFAVSSRQLIASPDAAASALVASSIGGLAVAGDADYATMALAQAIICGVVFLLAAVFKLGFLAAFLSKPVLIGFIAGLALDILVSQVAKMLGVPIDSSKEFVEKLVQLAENLGEVDVWSVVIAVVSVLILVIGRRIARLVPWALIVLILTTVVVVILDLDGAGVDVLGEVPAGPPTLTWPVLDWATWFALVPSALALVLVTVAEGLLVARAYAEKNGYPDAPNRDLFAFGVSNLAAGATGGYVVGASASRTAAMDLAGARTQLPAIVAAAGTLLLLLFGTALLADIPSPAIGAVVAVAVFPLLGFREFAELFRTVRSEFLIAVVCFAVTLFVGAIPGILVAFVLALVNLARRAARPALEVLADDDSPADSLLASAPRGSVTAPGVVVVRLAAPLFFANAGTFTDAGKAAVEGASSAVDHFVLDCESVTDLDVTGAEAFRNLRTWLGEHDVTLSLSRVRPSVRARFERFGLLDGVEVYDTNRQAVRSVRDGGPRGAGAHPTD